MIRWAYASGAALCLFLLATLSISEPVAAQRTAPLPEIQAPAVEDVLRAGVLIVISKASQRMYVFKDGEPWQSSAISSGKRGHSTPSGVFPILQKAVRHRSNIYSNAPMPYMQRLTWGGIAIHAGHLPGYPASHGCVRLPLATARALYALTRTGSTTVVIIDGPIQSFSHAGTLALNAPVPLRGAPGQALPQAQLAAVTVETAPPSPQIAYLPLFPSSPFPTGPNQTIQLAAAPTPAEADAHWARLLSIHPELERFEKAVIPVMVGARRFYRLRASAPGAFAVCSSLKQSGQDCFNVS